MSKEAQLPPRYPLQKKNTRKHDHSSPASCIGLATQPCHRTSIPQSFIIEEQPPWFDDLLSDQDSDSYLSSSSYSSTFIDLLNELGASTCESNERFVSSCTYGPNSPKRRSQRTFPIISEFSCSAAQSPLQYLDRNLYEPESAEQGKLNSSCGSNDESDNETKPVKRLHPGQRRRAHKLQYISELERTVCTLQNFESELAIKVSVMSRQRSILQAENGKLKQQMMRLHQEKSIADGQYQSLRKEAERLKSRFGSHCHVSKISALNELSYAVKLVDADATWQMLDLRKLGLG